MRTHLVLGALLIAPAFAGEAPLDPIQQIVETTRPEIDLNGDGKPDLFRTIDAGGRITESRQDRNFDGRIDEKVSTPAPGERVTRSDRDFDGFFEEERVRLYVGGRLVNEQISKDRDRDGTPDYLVERVFMHGKDVILETLSEGQTQAGRFLSSETRRLPLRIPITN